MENNQLKAIKKNKSVVKVHLPKPLAKMISSLSLGYTCFSPHYYNDFLREVTMLTHIQNRPLAGFINHHIQSLKSLTTLFLLFFSCLNYEEE